MAEPTGLQFDAVSGRLKGIRKRIAHFSRNSLKS